MTQTRMCLTQSAWSAQTYASRAPRVPTDDASNGSELVQLLDGADGSDDAVTNFARSTIAYACSNSCCHVHDSSCNHDRRMSQREEEADQDGLGAGRLGDEAACDVVDGDDVVHVERMSQPKCPRDDAQAEHLSVDDAAPERVSRVASIDCGCRSGVQTGLRAGGGGQTLSAGGVQRGRLR